MSQIKVELQETFGSDRSIAESAWTSSSTYQNKKLKSDDQVKDLVKRLASDKHSTPFESVIFKFWMKIPIQTDRQIMTHRIASHNGMSGRYRTMPYEYLDIPDDIENILPRLHEITWPNGLQIPLDIEKEYYEICERANNYYNALLGTLKIQENLKNISNQEYKRLREFFRGVLPQNNMTERVTIMNLRSFSNFIKLRLSPHAQPEIQEVAKQMLEAVKKSNVCPVAIESLEANGWVI